MLTVCPQCRYSLRGLPAKHRCPECGLEFDEQSEVYWHRRPRRLWWGILGAIWCLLHLGDCAKSMAGWHWLLFIAISPILLVVVLAEVVDLLERYRALRKGPLVAILPHGLVVRLETDVTIPWNQVRDVSVSADASSLGAIVNSTTGETTITGVFDSSAHRDRFVAAIKARTGLN